MPTPRPPVGGSEESEREDQFSGPLIQGPGWPLMRRSFTMANVQVFQRHAHLAGAVRIELVNGRDGKVARAMLTAISNTRRPGRTSSDSRDEEATAIQWTLWGTLAERAAAYLDKGSHVNIVGRVRNNNYEKDGEIVYSLAFTVDEIDYLDSRANAEARRAGESDHQSAPESDLRASVNANRPRRARNDRASSLNSA